MAILANTLQAYGVVIESSAAAQFILVSGKPLNEPIVQYGPFVMNSQQEIYQALADFRDGRLGEAAGSAPH
jgi:redox-sensitive bicupin YhaK (pirin superfamily)